MRRRSYADRLGEDIYLQKSERNKTEEEQDWKTDTIQLKDLV